MESQSARQGPHHRGDLHAHAQCPHQVGQAYSSAPEGSTTAQPRALHAAAGPSGIGRERRSLRGDARRSARRLWGPRREVSQRRLGPALAGWPRNAVLHAFSRSPPSWAGVYARASTRIPVAERGGARDLELGKAVERVWGAWRPRLRFLRNRSRGTPGRLGNYNARSCSLCFTTSQIAASLLAVRKSKNGAYWQKSPNVRQPK